MADQDVQAWLQLNEANMPLVNEASNIFRQPEVLTEIYSRGLADKVPPSFTLLHPIQRIETLTAVSSFTSRIIEGETHETICINTLPACKAWISTSCRIDAIAATSKHSIQVMVDNPGRRARRCQNPSCPRPVKVLVHNVRGAARPSFPQNLQHAISTHRPTVILVTETRKYTQPPFLLAQSPNYQTLHRLKPLGYLGGAWFMFKHDACVAQIVDETDRDLTVGLSLC
ncbi:hypothetical protein COLO4_07437 [Corchorus olitorius]|uniref:Endonuclease/exonuclease/phosphatase n=1 Tax=Corchorus olitorius TaxID=93759 RepID=A0A1R3KJR4_9ROSI|nr:hypothetical protein COLO4_07437 [Corchorus olitorius]